MLNVLVLNYHCAECHSVVGYDTEHYANESSSADCHVAVCFYPNVMFHIVLLHNAIPLIVIVPNTLTLNGLVLDYHCAECHSVVGRDTNHYATDSLFTKCHSSEYHSADCHFDLCHLTE